MIHVEITEQLLNSPFKGLENWRLYGFAISPSPDQSLEYHLLLPNREAAEKVREMMVFGEKPVASSARECLKKMLEADAELYERMIDCAGFAYWFNELCLMAQAAEGGVP